MGKMAGGAAGGRGPAGEVFSGFYAEEMLAHGAQERVNTIVGSFADRASIDKNLAHSIFSPIGGFLKGELLLEIGGVALALVFVGLAAVSFNKVFGHWRVYYIILSMLSRKYRLPLRKMPNFFTESEKFFTSDLTFFYRRGETDELQVAVIVPKKSQRLAVQRHRYKRIIAELIRKRIDEWPRDLQVAIVATGKIDAKTLGKSLEKFSNFLVL